MVLVWDQYARCGPACLWFHGQGLYAPDDFYRCTGCRDWISLSACPLRFAYTEEAYPSNLIHRCLDIELILWLGYRSYPSTRAFLSAECHCFCQRECRSSHLWV